LGSEHHLGRRSFVQLLAAGATACVAAAHGLVRPPSASAAPPATAEAEAETVAQAARAGRSDGIVLLGRAYLRDHPKEDDPDTLVGQLPGIDPARKVRPQLPALTPAADQDFGAGRVVSVQGWQLSQSEARAAAAVARGR
jgi:hypothetical protein